MKERVIPPLDEVDEEQEYETGTDEYLPLDFEQYSDHGEEGQIYESIQDEITTFGAEYAEELDDE